MDTKAVGKMKRKNMTPEERKEYERLRKRVQRGFLKRYNRKEVIGLQNKR